MAKAIAATPVMNSGVLIGHIIERGGGQFEAVPISYDSLGLFNRADSALNALIAASVTQGQGNG